MINHQQTSNTCRKLFDNKSELSVTDSFQKYSAELRIIIDAETPKIS